MSSAETCPCFFSLSFVFDPSHALSRSSFWRRDTVGTEREREEGEGGRERKGESGPRWGYVEEKWSVALVNFSTEVPLVCKKRKPRECLRERERERERERGGRRCMCQDMFWRVREGRAYEKAGGARRRAGESLKALGHELTTLS